MERSLINPCCYLCGMEINEVTNPVTAIGEFAFGVFPIGKCCQSDTNLPSYGIHDYLKDIEGYPEAF